MADNDKNISLATMHRMPGYLRYLKAKEADGAEYISSVGLAEAMQENPSVVKKDLSMAVVSEGKPKVGYFIPDLIRDIESFMGYDNEKDAVIVGAGKLGQALLGYSGFEKYGLNIVAGFDSNPALFGTEVHGKKILGTDKLESTVKRLGVKMAILTLPAEFAQEMADRLVGAGIRAIWNFSPVARSPLHRRGKKRKYGGFSRGSFRPPERYFKQRSKVARRPIWKNAPSIKLSTA